jgi:hypothetical protein
MMADDLIQWLRHICPDERGDKAADEIERLREELAALKAQPAQEPVARYYGSEMSRYCIEWINGPLPEGTLLYAAPQPSAEVEKDATRYRWLRGNYDSALAIVGEVQYFTAEGLDAAIDAAMKGQS